MSWVMNSFEESSVTRTKIQISSISEIIFLAATKQLYEWFSPSVCPPLVLGVVTRQKPQINGSVVLGADESPWPCGTPSWYTPLSWMILSKQKNLHLFYHYTFVFSLRRPSHLFDYVPIIVSSWNFQELLPVTEVTSMQKVKVRGQGHRGHNPT